MDFQCREVNHFRVFPCFNRKIGCPISRYYYTLIDSHPPAENVQALPGNNHVTNLDTPDLNFNIENMRNEKFCVEKFQKQFIIHVEKLSKLKKTSEQNLVPIDVVYFSVCLLGDAETAARYSYDLNLFDLQHFSLIKEDHFYTNNRSEPDSPKDYRLAVISNPGTRRDLKLSIILDTFSSCTHCDVSDGKIHRSKSGLASTNCANAIQNCKFKYKGCSFVDTYTKVELHRKWYCNYTRTCTICNMKITSTSLQNHYRDTHLNNLIQPYENWTDIRLQTSSTYFIIDHELSLLICEYKICSDEYLEFKVHSDKRSGDLYRYQCKLVYCIGNGDKIQKILKLGSCNNRVEKYSDWSTRIYLNNTNIISFQVYLTQKYPVFIHSKKLLKN